MPKLALLTALGGPIELAEFPLTAPALSTPQVTEQVHKHTDGIGADWVLEVVGVPGAIPDGVGLLNNGGTFPFERLMPKPFHLAEVNDAFASAGLVPRGALVP